MIKTTLVLIAISSFTFASVSSAAAKCRWIQGKGRVCTTVPNKKVVVVNPGPSYNPWTTFAGVVGTAIIIDKVTGEPKVEGKDSIMVETKLIESGKVDVIEKDGKVIFIKGIG